MTAGPPPTPHGGTGEADGTDGTDDAVAATRTDLIGSDGLRLAADVAGPDDGPTVVLLHGGGQTRHSWAGTWRYLADHGWRAWTVDLRGHGDSEWSGDGDYQLQAFAADTTAVAGAVTAETGRPPVLVGASLGGLSALVAVAEADPQDGLARALVLVDVAHRLESAGTDRIGAFMTGNLDGFESLDEAADVIAAYNPHRPRPTNLDGLAKNLRQGPDGRWRWHWDPRFVSGKFGAADETRATIVGPDLLERSADALRVPTLLVRGRSSDLLSEEGARDFLARVPHAEFADVAGAGHMVVGDRNEVFNSAVLEFLDRHRG
ncbi:MAG TPA: alpha/beta hydrolase [Microthrixaceae bacterium]|nr:alpha/beta hydrolase [Microthrixaceae bacterium]